MGWGCARSMGGRLPCARENRPPQGAEGYFNTESQRYKDGWIGEVVQTKPNAVLNAEAAKGAEEWFNTEAQRNKDGWLGSIPRSSPSLCVSVVNCLGIGL